MQSAESIGRILNSKKSIIMAATVNALYIYLSLSLQLANKIWLNAPRDWRN